MKKSKLSLGLVASFIGALALTACDESTSSVTKSKDSIVDLIGYNSKTEKVEINVDELYREYGDSKEGTTLYYNAILEALTRYEYPFISEKDSELKSYSRIESEAADKISATQQTARDNAKTNDTSFAEEWDKILDSNNVDSTKDLKLKFIYELEKEALSDWYFKKHAESTDTETGLREQFLGVTEDWKEATGLTENVDPVYPYHVLHILVKLDADATNYTKATITEAEAKKLWAVVRQLIDGQYTFIETAKLSDDTSKDDFGDVELMSTHTSFYNEFKLGIYAYDALLSGINTENESNDSLYKAFGIDANDQVVTQTMNNGGQSVETKENVVDLVNEQMVEKVNTHIASATPAQAIPAIPFDVFRRIGEVADDEKIGTFSPEGSSSSLPRNVLFNAFLNFRSPFVITNELLKEDSVSFGNDDIATEEYDFDDPSIIALQSNNFVEDKIPSLNKKVLCDTDGNVVIGVRSTAGIHFMVMRKSVFENTNISVGRDATSLEDYYTTLNPLTDEDFPLDKQTFVNMKKSNDVSYYTDRADTIKNDIKSTSTFDAAFDYRIYETLLDYEIDGEPVKDKIHFSDEDEQQHSQVRENIDNMISLLRETHHYSQLDSINKSWQEYLMQLAYQNELRSDDGMFEGAFVPTTCAFRFNKGNEDDWKEGGKCYVK